MLKILSNYAKYSGIWFTVAMNPYHWSIRTEELHPDELNPHMKGYVVTILPFTIRLIIDDGTW